MTVTTEAAAAEAHRLSERPGFPSAYVERVRTATTAFAAQSSAADDVRAALQLLRHHARVDAAVPVRSARPVGVYAKRAIRKGVGWYMRFVAAQASLLGEATVRLGDAVADRLDRLEAENEALRRRVAELEAGAGGSRGGAGAT